ncbi:DUF3891 family protein [Pedobacter sp. P26]|uniref:DUF3891 family protein n=1 Tax=Pedobacter sp. P26 TaxID=3423956 RepID=UPI003D669D9A
MIVNYCNSGWEIITQRAHGLLAGQICARWKISDQPQRWVETLTATTGHDDVFNEFVRGPLLSDRGGPLDFKMTGFDESACREMMDNAISKSRFIALLFSRHISFTHGDEASARPYLTELKKLEKKWIREAQSSTGEVDRAYALLEFCDAFSLLICQDQIPPEERLLEISKGPSGKSVRFFQQGQQLIVTPWPFEVDTFEVCYERLTLNEIGFENDEAFRTALRNAGLELRKLIISRE